MKRGVFRVVTAGLLLVLAGCTTGQGFYESEPAEGWKRDQDGSVSFFHPAVPSGSEGYVSCSMPRRGEVYLAWSFPGRKFEFKGDTLRLLPGDGGPARILPLAVQTLSVGAMTDFTIELPASELDGHPVPALRVHLRWSDRMYRSWGGGW